MTAERIVTPMEPILLVDDSPEIRHADARILTAAGHPVVEAETCRKGLQMVRQYRPALTVLDIVLPDGDGRELCRRIKSDPELAGCLVVLASGLRREVRDVVNGIECGADGFIRRPVHRQEFLAAIEAYLRIARTEKDLRCLQRNLEKRVAEQTAELAASNADLRREIDHRKTAQTELEKALAEIRTLKNRLETENRYLKAETRMDQGLDRIVGDSPAMRRLMAQVHQVADTDTTVLITGETGTGKELLAHAIHDLSHRRSRAMVTINCAAIPTTLVESELFGREKGAYTGALSRQTGRFEVADGSTLFLDEVSELPLETQAKLLRVLETGQFERLGSNRTVTADVRVIAATNRDMETMLARGQFRNDLYYRLNVFSLTVPPLRERVEDIPKMVWYFVKLFSSRMGRRIDSIAPSMMESLQRYPWPGNVRELRNVIERGIILSPDASLFVEVPGCPPSTSARSRISMDQLQREHILATLNVTGWRIRGPRGAAAILGLKPTTLESRMKKLGISRKSLLSP